jgi:DNA segregation ATPase FtsK/SpoIIIE-like protein
VGEASAELSSAVAVLVAEPEVAVAEAIVSEVVVSEVVISEAIEEAPAVAPAPVIPATLEEPVQPSLFADIAPEPVRPAAKSKGSRGAEPRSVPATASVAPTPKPSRRVEAVEEPEAPHAISDVVLTPVPSRSVSRVFLPEPTYRAGCLFLERNRVAVSMLQREFNMDFKVATAVLDQLQDVGLIGPYLGGQRRDILMSHDEWQEKVGVAE